MGAQRIWIVGKEWKVRALLRALLLEEGYEARGIETLAEALADLAAPSGGRPDALFVDLEGGTAASGEIGRLDALAASTPLRVVVLAGRWQIEADGPESRAHLEWIRLPVTLGEVSERVKAAAGKARSPG